MVGAGAGATVVVVVALFGLVGFVGGAFTDGASTVGDVASSGGGGGAPVLHDASTSASAAPAISDSERLRTGFDERRVVSTHGSSELCVADLN